MFFRFIFCEGKANTTTQIPYTREKVHQTPSPAIFPHGTGISTSLLPSKWDDADILDTVLVEINGADEDDVLKALRQRVNNITLSWDQAMLDLEIGEESGEIT